MRSQRILLFAAGVLVVGLVLGLVYALRADGPPRATITVDAGVARPQAPAPAAPPPRPAAPSAAPAAPAARPDQAPAVESPVALEPDEHVDEQGRIVRDHRGQGPSAPPSPLVPGSLAQVRQAVGPAVKACAAALPQPPERPVRLQVNVTLHAAAGRMTASDVSIDGADALGPDYAACVRRAFEALATDVPSGQPDGQDVVHMPFTAP